MKNDPAQIEKVERQFSPETWEALKLYQDAVEDFILEHSDLLPSGAIFVKFHADDIDNVRDRIWSRFRGWYHRMNLEERMEKARLARERREEFVRRKAEKKARHEAHQAELRAAKAAKKSEMWLPAPQRIAAEREVAEANALRRGMAGELADVVLYESEKFPLVLSPWQRLVRKFKISKWK